MNNENQISQVIQSLTDTWNAKDSTALQIHIGHNMDFTGTYRKNTEEIEIKPDLLRKGGNKR